MTTKHVSRSASRPRRATLVGFAIRKVGTTIFLLVGVTLMVFLLVNLVPGDAAAANLSEQAQNDPGIVQAYREKWGLDDPLPVQYFTYLGNVFQGDLGTSMSTGNGVLDDLAKYVPATIELAIPSIVLSLTVSLAVGMWAAVRKDRPADHGIRAAALVGLSTPSFWLAIVALWVGFYLFGIFPNGGRLDPTSIPPPEVTGMYTVDAVLAGQWDLFQDAVWHLVLPVLVMSTLTVSLLIRFVRSAMLEVLSQDYVRAATAKGLNGRTILLRHVLRAGLVQIITVAGLAFASLLSGTVLIEQVFSWPGMGQYAYRSAAALDLPAIMGVALFVAVVYIVLNLVVDLLYGVIDPRIRIS